MDLVHGDIRFELFDPEISSVVEKELERLEIDEWSFKHVLLWLIMVGQEKVASRFMQLRVDGLVSSTT